MSRCIKGRCFNFIALLIFVISIAPLYADVIKLKSGKTIEGTIVQQTDQYIKINFQGVGLTYFLDEVENTPTFSRTASYRITKSFSLKASADLKSVKFKSPLIRKDIDNQKYTNFYTEPKCNEIIAEQDRSETAVFNFPNVKSQDNIIIKVGYDVQIIDPRIEINPSLIPDDYGELKEGLLNYLRSEGNISINDEDIHRTAKSLTWGIKNPYWKGRALFDYILRNITYDNIYGVSGVRNPGDTLKAKHGNCVDITRLYIALCRSSGIPARQVYGLVFLPEGSKSKYAAKMDQIAHSWAEIYLPVYGWMPVDPTHRRNYYYCFKYKIHIKEAYGETVSHTVGRVYSVNFIEVTSYDQFEKVPVTLDEDVEIKLLGGS